MNLRQVAEELTRRLTAIFLRDAEGRRPVYGGTRKFQEDPHWRDYLSFHEYFHGDNGAGLGASHQTGWTGVIARLMQQFAPAAVPEVRRKTAARRRAGSGAGCWVMTAERQDGVVAPGATLEKLAGGFAFTEGADV